MGNRICINFKERILYFFGVFLSLFRVAAQICSYGREERVLMNLPHLPVLLTKMPNMARPMEAWRRGTSPGRGPVPTSTTSLGAPEMALEGTVRVILPFLPRRLDPSGSPPHPWGQWEPKSEGGAGQQRAYIDRISKHFGRTQRSRDRADSKPPSQSD